MENHPASRFLKAAFAVLTACLLVSAAPAFAQEPESPRIVEVVIEGAKAFSRDRIEEIISTRASGLFRTSRVSAMQLRRDVNALEYVYHQAGYLDAGVESPVTVNEAENTAVVTFSISEGEPTIVEQVGIMGNQTFPDSLLRRMIELHPGDRFTARDLETSQAALINFYSERGYIEAEVNPQTRINEERNLALVDFMITEREQAVIDNIIVTGLEKTREGLVRRELTFRRGDIVNLSELLESEHNLYLLGLFQSVFIRPEPALSGDPSKRDIAVTISEYKSGEVGVSIGYGTIEEVRFRIDTYENNLWGTSRKAGAALKWSSIERLAQLSTSAPRFLGTKWLAEASLILTLQREPGFDFLRRGAILTFGREFFSPNTRLNIYYRHENDSLRNVQTAELPDNFTPHIRSLRFVVVHDSRNNLFQPTEGIYVDAGTELGLFRSETRFLRLTSVAKFFWSPFGGTVLGTAFDVGWIDAPGGIPAVPLQERFYTGGPNSVRGFDYQKIGSLDEKGQPVGGRFQFVWNVLEVRQRLFWMFEGVAFFDAGNVWTNPEDLNLADLRTAAGAGLRLNSPIGLLRLDYGVKLKKQAGETRSKIYFSVGQAF